MLCIYTHSPSGGTRNVSKVPKLIASQLLTHIRSIFDENLWIQGVSNLGRAGAWVVRTLGRECWKKESFRWGFWQGNSLWFRLSATLNSIRKAQLLVGRSTVLRTLELPAIITHAGTACCDICVQEIRLASLSLSKLRNLVPIKFARNNQTIYPRRPQILIGSSWGW
jgi:hypothetical protein